MTPSGGLTRSDRSGGALKETPGRSQVSLTPSGGLTRSDRSGGANWQPVRSPWQPSLRAGGIGLLWAAWPCGLLQSALVVAALASGPIAAAVVMASFALGSAVGLIAGQRLLWGLLNHANLKKGAWAVRLAGLGLVSASAWALGHGLWMKVAAYCGF